MTDSNSLSDNITFISCKQLTAMTSLSKTAIYAKITPNPKRPGDYDPSFPRPCRIGCNRVAWERGAVQRWMASKVEASRAEYKSSIHLLGAACQERKQ